MSPGTSVGPQRARLASILADALASGVAATGVPGAVLALRLPDGRREIVAHGVADLATGEPMRPDLAFRIGSITKTFTATTILALAGDGALAIDDPVERWLPGALAPLPLAGAVTLRMLLNHTSGIYSYTEDDDFQDDYVDDPARFRPPEELVRIGLAHTPYFPPGTGWHYSNTGYVLLGLVIEAATGRRAEDVILERTVEPLALTRTTFPTTPAMPTPYAHGYLDADADGRLRPDEDMSIQSPSVAWTAGGMTSTAKDILSWLEAVASGAVLTPPMHEAQLTFDAPVPAELQPDAAFGLGIADTAGAIGHTGGVLGYTSVMYAKDGASVVVLANGYMLSGEGEAANLIYERVAEVLYGG